MVGTIDSPVFGQVSGFGAGVMVLIEPTYLDGTTPPLYGTTLSEGWYCKGTVLDEGTQLGILGIPFRIIDSFGRVQADDLTIAGGVTEFINYDAAALGFGAVGAKWKNMIAAADYNVSASAVLTTLDNPITIEINREDHPSHNPGYESKTIRTQFPRRLRYNSATQQYETIPYQRNSMEWIVTLKPPCSPGTSSGAYTRKIVPAVSYQHAPGPVTGYESVPVAVVPYVRSAAPGGSFTPCPGLPGAVTYRRGSVFGGSFTRKPIPAVTFKECGTADPDMFILLGPWMPKRVIGG
jgi:hypothetical protein